METNNGHALALADVDREIRKLAGMAPQIIELGVPSVNPFEQKAHDLMHETIDKVCADWVHQLKLVRENSQRLEQLVLEQATKVKSNITQLYSLGKAAAAEARRGEEVNQRLMREIESLTFSDSA
jgi:hypothetical protein